MTYDVARAKAQEAEESLQLSEPVSLESIHRHMERLRDRTIMIKPMPGTPTDIVCGLWFSVNNLDVIFHAPGASEVHRRQIVLHEFSHMILLQEQERVSPEYARKFFPRIDEESVVLAMKRSDFLDEFEITAELLADRLAARIRKSQENGGQPGNFKAVFG
ncbi:hypothetical protein WMO79_01000 [Micrococcaceae bacterium Sec7.4]